MSRMKVVRGDRREEECQVSQSEDDGSAGPFLGSGGLGMSRVHGICVSERANRGDVVPSSAWGSGWVPACGLVHRGRYCWPYRQALASALLGPARRPDVGF